MKKSQQPQAQPSTVTQIGRSLRSIWRQLRRFLIATGLTVTMISIAVYVAFWFVASHTQQIVSSNTTQTVMLANFEPGVPSPHPTLKPAGPSASIVEIIADRAVVLAYPQTATTPAHQFPGVSAAVTGKLIATDAPGAPVFELAVHQAFVWNAVTGQVILVNPPAAFVHTNYLWNLTQPLTLAVSSSAMSIEKVITLEAQVTRSSAYGVPSESYAVTLTLTIDGSGDVTFGVFAPAMAFV